MRTLPATHRQCQWCGFGVRLTGDGRWPERCSNCHLHPHPSKVDETVGGKIDPVKAASAKRNREGAVRLREFGSEPAGTPVLGVDPGARYTGVCLRDGDCLLFSSTFVRPKEMDPVVWARLCVEEIKAVLVEHGSTVTKMAVEGVVAPKGFKGGKQAPINPGPIVMAGVVLGAVAGTWTDALVVPPGKNGSQHITHYPPELVGRRPTGLPGSSNGAGTRGHEQSAWDVAGRAMPVLWEKPVLDMRNL